MIHISKSKKGNFIVANIGNNGEVLKSSEPLESKQACWKNIRSEAKNCYAIYGYSNIVYDAVSLVQDDTLKKPVVYLVGKKRVVANGIKPQTPHVPK